MNQEAKRDEGKLQLSLVPTQIIRDIAEVRMYGNKKYGDPDNWKNVEIERYIDALYRHFLAFIDDPYSVDEESGIPHRKHMACNMSFICDMMKDSVYEGMPVEHKGTLLGKVKEVTETDDGITFDISVDNSLTDEDFITIFGFGFKKGE